MDCELVAAYCMVLVECVVLPWVRRARMARRNDWCNNMLSDAKRGVEARTGSPAASKVNKMARKLYTQRSGSRVYFVRKGYIYKW
jgi:hypothetical protein